MRNLSIRVNLMKPRPSLSMRRQTRTRLLASGRTNRMRCLALWIKRKRMSLHSA